MGFYGEQVLPRITDLALGRSMESIRARVAAGLSGEVLELGFGSGRNVPHLPADVRRLLAVEPANVGRKLAARRIAARAVPVEFIGEDGAYLPLAGDSVDHALVTFTLCTIPDVDRALAEVRRVLRPGGTLHFVEHGRSPDPRVARQQDRFAPLWGRLCGGCHLNREIDVLIGKSGFQLDSLQQQPLGRPKLAGYLFEGVASKPTS